MTPTQLNKAIRDGEFFWVADPSWPGQEVQAIRARTVAIKNTDPAARRDAATGRTFEQERHVSVKTPRGWLRADSVRRAGSQERIDLFPEAAIIRAWS